MSDDKIDSREPDAAGSRKWKNVRTQQHQLKKDAIMEVATQCFHDYGYADTTLADVADHLGVTNKALYYYFKNKEDLFLETVIASQSTIRKMMEEIERAGGSGYQRVKTHVNRVVTESGVRGALTTSIPSHLLRSERGKQIRGEQMAQESKLVGWIKAGMDDGSIRKGDAYVFCHLLLGALVWIPRWAREETGYEGASLGAALELLERLMANDQK